MLRTAKFLDQLAPACLDREPHLADPFRYKFSICVGTIECRRYRILQNEFGSFSGRIDPPLCRRKEANGPASFVLVVNKYVPPFPVRDVAVAHINGVAGDLSVKDSRLYRRFKLVDRSLNRDSANDAGRERYTIEVDHEGKYRQQNTDNKNRTGDRRVPDTGGANRYELAVALHLGEADDDADQNRHRTCEGYYVRDQGERELPDEI